MKDVKLILISIFTDNDLLVCRLYLSAITMSINCMDKFYFREIFPES